MNDLDQIKKLEEELRLAMLGSDVLKLDSLISDNLIFTDHSGSIYTKEMDLHNHQSGNLKIDALYPQDQKIDLYYSTAIVSVLMRINGSFTGEEFNVNNRYTRVWVKQDGMWKIVAAHSSVVTYSE
ncbi:MAG: nuclear transport factor 2 family protein [Daejeonella sp.]|uniref:nuclear transport factor 2 family protein n=1 Tax=Daejeonella sp. JGW-45 TaxID=3034148 RepID=UPI0023EBF2F4|nr:nuclear transport factor 2 family protein [Daejeonella sp. JGW-45]